jgi:hypothetical protein
MLTSHVLDLCAARAAGHYTPIDPRLHLARAAEGSRLAMSRTECVNSGAHPYLWTDTSETYTEAIQLVKLRLGCATLFQDNTPCIDAQSSRSLASLQPNRLSHTKNSRT